jgi:Family of unknown function (DUF5989)
MIPRRGRMRRQLIVFGTAFGTTAELVRGIWHSGSRHRWLIPLAVMLCAMGLLLTLAASVEALAPFVYSIF